MCTVWFVSCEAVHSFCLVPEHRVFLVGKVTLCAAIGTVPIQAQPRHRKKRSVVPPHVSEAENGTLRQARQSVFTATPRKGADF